MKKNSYWEKYKKDFKHKSSFNSFSKKLDYKYIGRVKTDFNQIENLIKKLEKIKQTVLREVAGCAVSSDQFSRISDLAIDFCEDVPELSIEAVKRLKKFL